MPQRLHRTLLQRAARRRSVIAMPAEEHGKPRPWLRQRREGRGSSKRRRPQQPRPTLRRGAPRRRRKPAETAAPEGRGRKAKQRADFRDPQRVPLRLSQGLRGRADRRGAGAGVPREEQGEALGRPARRPSAAAGGGGAAPGRGVRQRTPAAPAAAPAVIVLRPLRPREEIFVLRSACGGDVRSICGGVAAGRRADRAMPGNQCRLAFAGVPRRAGAVRGAVVLLSHD